MSWEETFTSWARPLSKTEDEKCANAVAQIRKAIDASTVLSSHKTTVKAQGSYRNSTNVRQESDVDVYVRCDDVYLTDYSLSEGLTNEDVGLISSEYSNAQFKNEVESALRQYFGTANVTRGNKAFDIHANTYRVDADVVPCFEHRRYMRKSGGGYYFLSGTEFIADDKTRVINWPEQNYENGVAKSDRTHKAFKPGVRILKHLRYYMEDKSIAQAKAVPSYLLECLAWNVPDQSYITTTYTQMVRNILAHLFNSTLSDADCREWGEINELKYLFRTAQPWTRQQAHDFLSAAWTFIGFSN